MTLRPPESRDEASYRRLLFDPAVAAWLRPRPLQPFTDTDAHALLVRDLLHWEEHGWGPWVVEDRGEFAGRAGLSATRVAGAEAVEVAWAIVSAAQGRGLATRAALAAIDAARALCLDEVVSLTLPDNAASRRVMEKAGMRFDRAITHAGLPHVLYRLRLVT
ncbi:MAG TPA: GNAT family N-acetyltransferase [Solirubrobacteraceae bacterium]|nr:GNAT family N-acetyltransferase [Solirubrobacteraceae bacterium]